MKTRAAILLVVGQPLVIDEVLLPDPAPNQVIVKQFASGVCHSQLHQLVDPASRTPLLLGHESSGVVLEIGKDVTHVAPGDRVMITWIPRASAPGRPRPQRATVRVRDVDVAAGAFTWAEATIADEQLVVKLDPAVDPAVAAIIGCAVMTGCGAVLNTARVQAGDTVAVFGVGGVGLCVVQACANVGAARIIAVDVDRSKLELAARFGATDGIDATRDDPVARIRALTDGGVDFAFDAIGAPQTMAQALPAVRPGISGLHEGGTAVLVGFPQPAAPTATLNMVDLFSARTYRGTIGGSSRPDVDFPRYVQWFKDGKLPLDELVTRRFTLDQVNEACTELQAGRIPGRAILEFGLG